MSDAQVKYVTDCVCFITLVSGIIFVLSYLLPPRGCP